MVLFFVYLAFRWLSCRGQFMLLEAVVENGIAGEGELAAAPGAGGMVAAISDRVGSLAVFNICSWWWAVIAGRFWNGWMFGVMLNGRRLPDDGLDLGGAGCRRRQRIAGVVVAAWVGTLVVDHFMVPVMFLREMEARPAFRHAAREYVPEAEPQGMAFCYLLMMQLDGDAARAAGDDSGNGHRDSWRHLWKSAWQLMTVPLLSLVPLFPMVLVALPVECLWAGLFALFPGTVRRGVPGEVGRSDNASVFEMVLCALRVLRVCVLLIVDFRITPVIIRVPPHRRARARPQTFAGVFHARPALPFL